MKKLIYIISLFLMIILGTASCNDYPVDEDGLLITTRTECYVSNFNLLDTDHSTILIGNAYVDTTAQVVVAYVRFGTILTNLWPQVSLCEDAKLDPKITSWTDFSGSKMNFEFIDGDWSSSGIATTQLGERVVTSASSFPSTAKKYTVISGTRKIKKEYTFIIIERPIQ